MTEPLQVGQFGIVDHEPVDRGPNAGIFHSKGPAGERAELFVLAEGTTPASEGFAAHVVSDTGQKWTTLDMSMTGSLRKCFAEAEKAVADWNAKSIAQHRVAIGLTCFARNGSQAVIAQAGPAVAFHLHRGRLQVYTPDPDRDAPIGESRGVDPTLTRIALDPGDRLLLVSTAAMQHLDDELIGGIMGLPGPRVLQDLYRRVHKARHLTVLLVESPAQSLETFTTENSPPAPAQPQRDVPNDNGGGPEPVIGETRLEAQHRRGGFQPSLFIEHPDPDRYGMVEEARQKLSSIHIRSRWHSDAPQSRSEQVAPLQRAVGDDRLGRLAAEQRQRASVSSAASAAALTMAQDPSWRRSYRGRAEEAQAQPANGDPITPESSSFSRSLVQKRSQRRVDDEISMAPLVAEMAQDQRNRGGDNGGGGSSSAQAADAPIGAMPLVRPRSNMGGRWRGSGSLGRRSVVAGGVPPTRLVVVVGLGLLLVLVGVFALPNVFDSTDEGRVATLVSDAQAQLAAARVQEDPAAERDALTQAKALLLEAEEVGGTSTHTQELMNEVSSALGVLDAVTEPARVETIGDLSSFGDAAVTPSDIGVGPDTAFLLDTTGQQVIAQPLDGSGASVIYALNEEVGHGRPVALAYDVTESQLFVADNNGAVWLAGNQEPQRLDLAVEGMTVTDIAVHQGELFVLDAEAGQVLRFARVEGEYPFEPQLALESPYLDDAVRVMVDDEIITSAGDGTLRRYSGQLELELSQAGIDTPLSTSAAPWPMEDGSIAVSDPPNDRVVELRRDGTFIRQYQHESFKDVGALALRGGAGFLFADNNLLRITWQGE